MASSETILTLVTYPVTLVPVVVYLFSYGFVNLVKHRRTHCLPSGKQESGPALATLAISQYCKSEPFIVDCIKWNARDKHPLGNRNSSVAVGR